MKQEQFDELVRVVKAGWPEDRIIKQEPTALTIQCENGGFIRFSLMLMPEDLLATSPPVTIDLIHEKLLIQWTPELEAKHYKNLGFYISKNEWPENEAMKEALKELNFRVQLGKVLA